MPEREGLGQDERNHVVNGDHVLAGLAHEGDADVVHAVKDVDAQAAQRGRDQRQRPNHTALCAQEALVAGLPKLLHDLAGCLGTGEDDELEVGTPRRRLREHRPRQVDRVPPGAAGPERQYLAVEADSHPHSPARPGRRSDSPRAGGVDPVRAAPIIAEAETIGWTSVGAEPIEPDTAFRDGLVRAGVDVEDQPDDAPQVEHLVDVGVGRMEALERNREPSPLGGGTNRRLPPVGLAARVAGPLFPQRDPDAVYAVGPDVEDESGVARQVPASPVDEGAPDGGRVRPRLREAEVEPGGGGPGSTIRWPPAPRDPPTFRGLTRP